MVAGSSGVVMAEAVGAGELVTPETVQAVRSRPTATLTNHITCLFVQLSHPAYRYAYLRRIVRAALARPVARTVWKGKPLLVWRTRVSDKAEPTEPGRVWLCGEEVCVDTPDKLLVLQVVQPAGKRKMTGPEWARGAPIEEGATLSS
jgi:methionyl-tRNA formyltransferase